MDHLYIKDTYLMMLKIDLLTILLLLGHRCKMLMKEMYLNIMNHNSFLFCILDSDDLFLVMIIFHFGILILKKEEGKFFFFFIFFIFLIILIYIIIILYTLIISYLLYLFSLILYLSFLIDIIISNF